MRASIIAAGLAAGLAAVLTAALACDRAPPPPTTPSGAAGAESTAPASVPPKALVEVESVQPFLAAQGVQVKSVTTLGPMSELACAASKHDRVTLADNAQVEVSRFANDGAAQECLAVLHKNLGEGWPAVSQDYLVHGHWLVVSAWDVPAVEREKIHQAFAQAL